MEKSKRLLTLVAITAVLTISTVALAINGNFFTFIDNVTDIIEVDRRITMPFTLENLPEFFSASVVVEGSGYTGQPHQVDITISHTRPDSSIWLASGDYSLDLELTEGTSEETITFGSFSDLRIGTPYVAPTYPWTPQSSADTYQIVLSLNNIAWTGLSDYTYSSDRLGLVGTVITFTGASFNGTDPNTYSAGDTVDFVIDAVWDEGNVASFDLSDMTWEVKVNRVGSSTINVLTGVNVVFDPALTAGEVFQFTGSFTQPDDVGGDWVILIRVASAF